jgi:DNA-directed RNA polymerase III subunit RPC3
VISSGSIKQLIEKKTSNKELIQYFDQYLSIIERDPCGFLKASPDAYGAYQIHFASAFKQLTWSVIENAIMQKFGNKAARIFRVVKTKKFIEQDDIQREAMMSAKEARLFTYNLLENNLLQIQTIKKSGGNSGPAKPFFLFHVNQQRIARDLIETCYKALYNSKVRVIQDKEANKRLMEKSIRLQFFIESLRERGEPEENIQEINETLTPPEKEIVEKTKMRLKRLESSEIMIDEMLLVLQLFIHYQTPASVHNR